MVSEQGLAFLKSKYGDHPYDYPYLSDTNIWSVIKTIFIIFVIIVIVIVLWTVGKVYWNKYKKKIRWKKRFRDSQGISTRREYNKSKRRRPSRGTSSVKSSESKQNP